MNEMAGIVIVGAGAAGMAGAIAAARAAGAEAGAERAGLRRRRVVVLEGSRQIGAKVLIAGGGRCNVTHERVTADDYHGPRNIVRNVLAGFDQPATVRWFEGLGVPLMREETGKLFPVGNNARGVVDALERRCTELGVLIFTEHRVREILPPAPEAPADEAAFTIRHDRGQMQARRVIVATGGRSWPQMGASAQGFDLVRALGHSVTDLQPALVPLVLEEGFFHASLTGLAHDAVLSVVVDGKRVDERRGSLLWTHFGVSGPVVLDASRHWVIAHAAGRKTEVRCNLLGGDDFAAADRWLTELTGGSPQRLLDTLLARRLPRRLAETLVVHAGIDRDIRAGQLRREQRRDLAHALVELPLPVTGDRGWQAAEVTAGGVPLHEIDYRTMQSRRCPGLYLAGEMLDCDGRLGGFNLQWAWTTGTIAGRSAAGSL